MVPKFKCKFSGGHRKQKQIRSVFLGSATENSTDILKNVIILPIELVKCVQTYLSEQSSSNVPLLLNIFSLQNLPQTMLSSDLPHTTVSWQLTVWLKVYRGYAYLSAQERFSLSFHSYQT